MLTKKFCPKFLIVEWGTFYLFLHKINNRFLHMKDDFQEIMYDLIQKAPQGTQGSSIIYKM